MPPASPPEERVPPASGSGSVCARRSAASPSPGTDASPCPGAEESAGAEQTAGAASSRSRRPLTLVLMVRHATTGTTGELLPGRARGLHLSPSGRAEAAAAAARISQIPELSCVYSSPMERAKETAEPIAAAADLPVREHPGLNECDFGDWTGRKLDELRRLPAWKSVQLRPSGFRFPGGESFAEMQVRVSAAVEELAAAHCGAAIVAVSHADPIKAAAANAAGMHLDCFQRLVIAPASVTALAYGGDTPLLLTLNSLGDDLKTLGLR